MPALTALCPDFSTMQGRKQAASAGVSCFSCISSLSSNARQSSKTFKRQVVLARGSQSLTTHHLYNNGACQQFRSLHILCKTVSRRGEQKHNMPWEGRTRCAHRKRRSRDAMTACSLEDSSPMIMSMASMCFWKSLEKSRGLHAVRAQHLQRLSAP